MLQSAIPRDFDDDRCLGRMSAFSEASDSTSFFPSFISPRPLDNSDNIANTPTYSSWSRRLADDPSASMLDLGEDVRSSGMASEISDDDDDEHSLDGDGVEPLSRMSYLGPKMRFHSPAPWEMEGDALDEEDETETTQSHFVSIFNGSRTKGGRKSSSSSPRPSNVSRPSIDSRLSQIVPKRSFETSASHSVSHPRGALYALAQESLSTSSLSPSLSPSLTRPSHSGRQDGSRNKFPLGRFRENSPNISSPDSSTIRFPLNNRTRSFGGDANAQSSPRESYASSALDLTAPNPRYAERHRLPSYSDGNVHPYANPDLVVSYTAQPALRSPPHAVEHLGYTPQALHDDSGVTVSEYSSATITSSEPSSSGPSTRRRISHVQGKDISSPIHFQNTLLHTESKVVAQSNDARGPEPTPSMPVPLGASIPGWAGRFASPGFSLISLEEARAQRARSGMVSGSGNVAVSMDLGSGSRSSGSGSAGESMQATPETFNNNSESNHSPYHHVSSQSRTRSTSAGAKAKNALQTFVGMQNAPRKDSDPFPMAAVNNPSQSPWPSSGRDEKDKERQRDNDNLNINPVGGPAVGSGKNLKHKKSGFMRLFSNSGKDKEAPSLPPPVPPLPDSSSDHAISKANAKHTLHRIPVPSLSPSLLEAMAAHESSNNSQDAGERANESGTVTATLKSVLGPKRMPPPALSINTATKGNANPPTGSAPIHNGINNDGSSSAGPQSAPAQVSDFPTLKLRPVSTLFSEQFSEHLVGSDLDQDSGSKGRKDNPSSNDRVEGQEPRQQQKHHHRQGTLATIASAPAFTIGSSGPSTASFSDFGFASSPVTSVSTGMTTPVTSAGPGLVSPGSTGTWNWTAIGQQSRVTVNSINTVVSNGVNDASMTKELQEQFESSRKAWQRRISELEGQVRDLKFEVEEWKNRCQVDGADATSGSYCEACGRGRKPAVTASDVRTKPDGSVMHRPRARTGTSLRFNTGQLS